MPRQDLSKLKGELVDLLAMADEYNSLLAQVCHYHYHTYITYIVGCCCYITVDSVMASSENRFMTYKLFITKKNNIIQKMKN